MDIFSLPVTKTNKQTNTTEKKPKKTKPNRTKPKSPKKSKQPPSLQQNKTKQTEKKKPQTTKLKKSDLMLGVGINEQAILGNSHPWALSLSSPLKYPSGPVLCNSVTKEKVLSDCISLHFRELQAWFTRADKALRSSARRANPFLAIGIYWLLSGCLRNKCSQHSNDLPPNT